MLDSSPRRYAQLPTGVYTFSVYAVNAKGVSSIASRDFTIK